MTTVTKSTAYDTDAKTRTVEQTVTYTYADDIRMLAQAQVVLANLCDALSQATHPTVIAQLEGQIEDKQAEVDALRAIVDGYSGTSANDYAAAYNIVTGESEA